MSRWADQFNSLAIHATIKNAYDALAFETEELDNGAHQNTGVLKRHLICSKVS